MSFNFLIYLSVLWTTWSLRRSPVSVSFAARTIALWNRPPSGPPRLCYARLPTRQPRSLARCNRWPYKSNKESHVLNASGLTSYQSFVSSAVKWRKHFTGNHRIVEYELEWTRKDHHVQVCQIRDLTQHVSQAMRQSAQSFQKTYLIQIGSNLIQTQSPTPTILLHKLGLHAQ